ncbi:nucleoside kinase [bacterium]|nr:nucleoside kinase [candidate division CSSED10-310 bacterium]
MLHISLPDGTTMEVQPGLPLLQLMSLINIRMRYPIVVAKVNNKVVDLYFRLHRDSTVEFIDLSSQEGVMAYYRSLTFVLAVAVTELMPREVLVVDHSISKGLYCHFRREHPLSDRELHRLETKMREIIGNDIGFIRHTFPISRAIRMFEEGGQKDKARLLRTVSRKRVNVYSLGEDGPMNYFYGPLVPSTGVLTLFKLQSYSPGFILRFPQVTDPTKLPELRLQPRLFSILQEHEEWGRILRVEDASDLNQIITRNEIKEFIMIAEALHSAKIVKIADMIHRLREPQMAVLIAGPSCSGKTTFLKRLYIQLRVHGFKPTMLSIDDYFVNRDQTPRDEKGHYDFESIEAIDLELLNQHLLQLMDGHEVIVPKFDFAAGCRLPSGTSLKLSPQGIILMEGIHCLNDQLTASLPSEKKYKIYVSALTHLNIDNHNRIPTSDMRLLRRIIRDMQYRGYTPLDTVKRWSSVRAGEERNIFPFQEEANTMFNSALFYELSVLKAPAERMLRASISRSEKEYSEARRLLKFMSYFRSTNPRPVPQTSILREFIGHSAFTY